MCFPGKYRAAQCCACTDSSVGHWLGLRCSLREEEPQSLRAERTRFVQGAVLSVIICSGGVLR